jgi:sugar (pentulose or hexulose) kinase
LFEVDAGRILGIVKSIITHCKSRISSVYLSVQMHGYILSGRGAPLVYVSWRDRRAEAYGYSPQIELKENSGTKLKANLPLVSVLAERQKRPESFANQRTLYTLGSFVSFCLTGRNITHVTDAAASGFYDVYGRSYDYGLPLVLPEARQDVSCVGVYGGIEIFTPTGDQQTTVLGLEYEDKYILNIGTAAQACTVDSVYSDAEYECRPFFRGGYLPTISGLIGGAVLTDKGSEVPYKKLADNYAAAVEKLPRRSGLIVTGGAAEYHRELIVEALKHTGIRFAFADYNGTMAGLYKLADMRGGGII